MDKKGTLVVKDPMEDSYLTIQEICVICHLSEPDVQVFIEHAIVQPDTSNERRFTLRELQRLQKALRLERDLHVNHEGAAVILNLLDELEELRTRLDIFERHY